MGKETTIHKLEPDNKKTSFVTGVLVGLLLAGGAFLALKKRLTPPPIVQTVTVEKVVTKTRRVEVPVTNTVTNTVKELKLYKAQLVEADGNVQKEWEVTACKFKVIGATLTDKDGHSFVVTGHIRVRPIKDASDAPKVSEVEEDSK